MGFVKFLLGIFLALVAGCFLLSSYRSWNTSRQGSEVISHSCSIEPPSKRLLDMLNSNSILDDAELYYEGPFNGTESIIELPDGSIIASDQSGAVFKLTPKQARVNITQLKFPCELSPFGGGGAVGNNNCGWPLGMRLDLDGNLLLMDYFGGMAKVDLTKGSNEVLVPKGAVINDKIGQVPEDLDVALDGTIYWTDGSSTDDFFGEMLGQPSGRLLKYNPVKKNNEVLLDDIHFSNGIQLSEKNDFALISEFGSASIRRYYLKGEKKGESDIFVAGLPGYPDNIRSNGKGGFYVALYMAWNEEYSMRTQIFSSRPLLRKFVLRLRHVLLGSINFIKQFLPEGNIYLSDFESYVLEFRPILQIHKRPLQAIVAELSETGEVIRILNGRSGKMPNLSQITVGKKYAYLVCPFDNKIWRIKLSTLA